MYKTILFDLDGTLLPMDQDIFVKAYFGSLAKKMIPHGYESQKLIDAIWKGTAAMVTNNGSCTNETAFWNYFTTIFGTDALADQAIFEDFYENDFQKVAQVCDCNPDARALIDDLKANKVRILLATNPIFPSIATQSRIRWAGLSPEDFDLITTYENSHFGKPNPVYYKEVLETAGCHAEDCLMVGNDVTEDMVARSLGMDVFLLTDCLINKENEDISVYPHGGFAELRAFLGL